MSDKKFIVSTIAIGTVEPVSIDNVFTFRKEEDFANVNTETSKKHQIAFYKVGDTLKHEPIKWAYRNQSERDCDYDMLINKYADNINISE